MLSVKFAWVIFLKLQLTKSWMKLPYSKFMDPERHGMRIRNIAHGDVEGEKNNEFINDKTLFEI